MGETVSNIGRGEVVTCLGTVPCHSCNTRGPPPCSRRTPASCTPSHSGWGWQLAGEGCPAARSCTQGHPTAQHTAGKPRGRTGVPVTVSGSVAPVILGARTPTRDHLVLLLPLLPAHQVELKILICHVLFMPSFFGCLRWCTI